jgi:hypothetical protein
LDRFMRLVPLFLLALAGCVPHPDAARTLALNAAIGESEADLLRGLGPPAQIAQAGDRVMLTYVRTDAITDPFRPDPSTVPLVDAVGAAWNYPPEATLGRCTTTFTVLGGRVVSWGAQGAVC